MEEINSNEFKDKVLGVRGLVLVDFYADWCGPCQMMKPVLEEFARNNESVKVVGINIDDNVELASSYDVASIPCIILFGGGKEIKRVVGVQSIKKLEKMIGD